jgi:prevent-host-death family protein
MVGSTVGSYKAKTHLSRLLDQVEQGDTITITKHGRAVARLVPADPHNANRDETISALRRARVSTQRGAPSIRDMIEEGRR